MALRNRILSGIGLVVTFVTFTPAIAAMFVDQPMCGNHVTDPLTVWVFAMLAIYAAWHRQPRP